jgi:hypothetical protein
MTEQKKYYGTGWFSKKYKEQINFKIVPEELMMLPRDSFRRVNLIMCERKTPSENSGATHYIIENTYKPQQKPVSQQKKSEPNTGYNEPVWEQ